MSGVSKGWTVEKSKTTKKELIDIYRQHVWKRRHSLTNKYIEKGLAVEEDAITLFTLVKKVLYKKNAVRLNNRHFTGEIDIYLGEDITKATRTYDIKSCWDWSTFPNPFDPINKDYDFQGQTYMDLSGASMHTLVYCLVNTPAKLIVDEKRKLAWNMGIIDTQNEDYRKGCAEIEKNCIYDMELFYKENPGFEFDSDLDKWQYDIPAKERICEIDILKDRKKIDRMKERTVECKLWMKKNLFKNRQELLN